jgi:hypothetical protein
LAFLFHWEMLYTDWSTSLVHFDADYGRYLLSSEGFAKAHMEIIYGHARELGVGILLFARLTQPGIDFDTTPAGCIAFGVNLATKRETIRVLLKLPGCAVVATYLFRSKKHSRPACGTRIS